MRALRDAIRDVEKAGFHVVRVESDAANAITPSVKRMQRWLIAAPERHGIGARRARFVVARSAFSTNGA
jgi:hypothetical protein